MFAQGMATLTELGNKYKDNESITGFVTGTLADVGRTQAMGGISLGYNKAMSAHLAQLNQGLENLKTGNQLKLMGAEGRIAKDLIGAQGNQQRMGIRETGSQQRLGIAATGEQQRLGIQAKGVEDRAGIRETGREERMNIGARGREQRAGIQETGRQERRNIGKRYQEERNMRADARGAIRSLGARFFG